MNVRMLWITRNDDDVDVPELIEAWDEFSIDENPEGAKEAFKVALDKVGSAVDQFRYITLNVPINVITDCFKDTVLDYRNSPGGGSK